MEINKDIEKKYPWKMKWDKRTGIISGLILDNKSILDLGGGIGNLYGYTKPSKYISVDLEKWTDKTIVADLNIHCPDLGEFDYIICQGIIEYIQDTEKFLSEIKKYGNTLIISYRLDVDKIKVMSRNSFSFQEIEQQFKKVGWVIKGYKEKGKIEKIYFCIKNDIPRTT